MKFKVIKPAPGVPLETVSISEDALRLDLAIALIQSLDPLNLGAGDTQEERDFASDMRRSQVVLLKTWKEYARRKLQRLLAPQPSGPLRKRG